MKTLAEKIAVMQAALEGKKIEIRDHSHGAAWQPIVGPGAGILWNWSSLDYRVATEPLEEALDIYIKTFEKCQGSSDLRFDRKTALAAVLKHFDIIKD